MATFTKGTKTYTVAIDAIARTTEGALSVDILNTGTQTAHFTGSIAGSLPVPIPAGYCYTLEFNGSGFFSITIDNTGNDDVLGIVEKY